MSTCERVSLLDAARELGMNPQGLREYMKRGLIDIGLVLPNSKGTGFRYIIMREKLNRILGKEREGVFYGTEENRQYLSQQVKTGQVRKVLVKYDVDLAQATSVRQVLEQLQKAMTTLIPFYEATRKL